MSHRLLRTYVVAIALTLVSGCAAVNAEAAIDGGTLALEAAEAQDAAKYARYAYTKAQLLLTEAKTRNGYGDYRIAAQWASEATDLANEAERTAKSRKNLEEQKNRIKRASERLKQRKQSKQKTGGSKRKVDTKKTRPTTPPVQRKKLLPPTRTKRSLLPPKRPVGAN